MGAQTRSRRIFQRAPSRAPPRRPTELLRAVPPRADPQQPGTTMRVRDAQLPAGSPRAPASLLSVPDVPDTPGAPGSPWMGRRRAPQFPRPVGAPRGPPPMPALPVIAPAAVGQRPVAAASLHRRLPARLPARWRVEVAPRGSPCARPLARCGPRRGAGGGLYHSPPSFPGVTPPRGSANSAWTRGLRGPGPAGPPPPCSSPAGARRLQPAPTAYLFISEVRSPSPWQPIWLFRRHPGFAAAFKCSWDSSSPSPRPLTRGPHPKTPRIRVPSIHIGRGLSLPS